MRILLIVLLSYSASISARMYQWIDPESGTTQLSGKPPMWYRSAQSGPRVFVFEKSKVIDDTGIEVSDLESERLRQRAFLQADEDRNVAREKLLESKRLDAALMQKQAALEKDEEQREPMVVDFVDEQAPEALPAAPEEEPTTIEQMRKLIADWEKATTEKARGLLDIPAATPQ